MDIITKMILSDLVLIVTVIIGIKLKADISNKDYKIEGLDNIEFFLTYLLIGLVVILVAGVIARIWSY
jgi:hypothetical protein